MPNGYKKKLAGLSRKERRGGGTRTYHKKRQTGPRITGDVDTNRDQTTNQSTNTNTRTNTSANRTTGYTEPARGSRRWRRRSKRPVMGALAMSESGWSRWKGSTDADVLRVLTADTDTISTTTIISTSPTCSNVVATADTDTVVDEDDRYCIVRPHHRASTRKAPPTVVGQCAICFDHKPLIVVSTHCHHQLACARCLVLAYTVRPKANRDGGLKCFHPACNVAITAGKLRCKGVMDTRAAYLKVLSSCIMVKARAEHVVVARCPGCSFPHPISRIRNKWKTRSCRRCKETFDIAPTLPVNSWDSTLRALAYAYGPGSVGVCPRCGQAIVKQGGCSHMVCGACEFEFNWVPLAKYNVLNTAATLQYH